MSRPMPLPPGRRPAPTATPGAPRASAPAAGEMPAGALPVTGQVAPPAGSPAGGKRPAPTAAIVVPPAIPAPDLQPDRHAGPPRGRAARVTTWVRQNRVVAALIGAALSGAGAFFGFRTPSAPDEAEVTACVLTQVHDDRLRLVSAQRQVVFSRPPVARVQAEVVLETVDALYEPVDAAKWLQRELGWDPNHTAAAFAQASPRVRDLAGPPPATLAELVLLKPVSRAGTTFTYAATIDALRTGTGWDLHPYQTGFRGPAPGGQSKASAGRSFVVTEPGDVDELKRLVASQKAYLGRLADADKQVEEEARQRAAQLAATLKPGIVCAGLATRPDATQALSIELTRVDLVLHRITGWLRNEDGWAHARRLDGHFHATGDELWLVLQTGARDAIPGAGPVLDEPSDLQINVQLGDPAWVGTLTGGWEFRATVLNAADVGTYATELRAKDVARQAAPVTAVATAAPRAASSVSGARTAVAPKPSAPAPGNNATAGAAEPDPRDTARAAGAVVRTVRDVKAAAASSGSFFDRVLATASAALSGVPAPRTKSKPVETEARKVDEPAVPKAADETTGR